MKNNINFIESHYKGYRRESGLERENRREREEMIKEKKGKEIYEKKSS